MVGGMAWFYTRDRASLSLETRYDNETFEYVAIVFAVQNPRLDAVLTVVHKLAVDPRVSEVPIAANGIAVSTEAFMDYYSIAFEYASDKMHAYNAP
jgi:hypothetical protein